MDCLNVINPSAESWQLLQEKRRCVEAALIEPGRVLVAFSGGVDSTLLAVLARRCLGKTNMLAVTADSPSLSRRDLADACALAIQLDLDHRVIQTREVANPAYQANTPTRCYYCKHTLFVELETVAQAHGIPAIVYGAIADDLLEERPGQQAAAQRGVQAPLQDAGLAKWEIRLLARFLDIPNWARPQNACLSSRVPHGHAVTEDKLRQIEQAEALLMALGFRQVRVRHADTHARIEVGQDEVERLREPAIADRIVRGFHELGFASIGMSREGYRAGGADRQGGTEEPLQADQALGGVAQLVRAAES